MDLTRRRLAGTVAATTALAATGARAQGTPPVIRIGLMGDFSGVYRDVSGPTSAVCMQQAVDEFAAQNGSFRIETLTADHQNKPDLAGSLARQWIDGRGVDAIVDGGSTPCGFLINTICREKNKVFLCTGSGSSDMSGKFCSPNNVHWVYDTYALANTIGTSITKGGADRWFYIVPNYVFGQQLERDTAAAVQAAGGKSVGAISYAFPETTDFASALLQAQASGATVLALCNSGLDTVNCIKQAREFGMTRSMKIAPLLMYTTDVRAIGLEVAAGLSCTEAFYWDLNDRTRAFMSRIKPKVTLWPNMLQAGAYSATLHYLKAVADLGVAAAKADGMAAVARMKAMPTDDDAYGKGVIRPDGRKTHPFYLFEVKTPAESTGPWDVFKPVASIEADKAFRATDPAVCSLGRA